MALRVARAAAESANVAKSAFLARMSHEMRTPLNGMVGMADLMMETELTPTQQKYAQTIQRSGAELMGVIGDVLDFSRIEAGRLTLEAVNFDLRRVIEDVADTLAGRAQAKGLDFVCNIPPGLPLNLVGDPRRIGQILANLADNAIKFTDKGSVLIEASITDETRDHVNLRVSVKDTGPGIARDAQLRIFDEFAHADVAAPGQRGGAGMGLAISRQLIDLMGGDIQVQSSPGAGATFWFTLTLAKQPQPTSAPAPRALDTLHGVRVLIAASSVLSREVLQAQAAAWGMTARVAEGREPALDLLRQAEVRGAAFDMLVMDVAYGGEAMLELVRLVKADAAIGAIKMVLQVPVGHYTLTQQARAAGVQACLMKPVRQAVLQAALLDVMQGRVWMDERRGKASAGSGGGAAQTAQPDVSRGKVLLVEDNEINQEVALGILGKFAGCEVVVAQHGVQALDCFDKDSFDLILMDVDMPRMDGLAATREIRRRER
ncbi:MAG: response regulator [Betaproteobacteria bacterium]|nr:response regulator [Betaproteobacteria bacterium]